MFHTSRLGCEFNEYVAQCFTVNVISKGMNGIKHLTLGGKNKVIFYSIIDTKHLIFAFLPHQCLLGVSTSG